MPIEIVARHNARYNETSKILVSRGSPQLRPARRSPERDVRDKAPMDSDNTLMLRRLSYSSSPAQHRVTVFDFLQSSNQGLVAWQDS